MKAWGGASESTSAHIEVLKSILDRMQAPDELDNHPWARSPLVAEALSTQPELLQLRPGRQLLFALTTLFADMMPSLPPRQGLRLDTRWGEFGILAARYFAPLKYGATVPTSLRDSWGRIDQAILLFVYGRSNGSLSAADIARYRLVGGEPEVAADSTLSDWHRKGLQRLAVGIKEREARLELQAGKSARHASVPRRIVAAVVWLATVGALALAGAKGYRIYRMAEKLRSDAQGVAGAGLTSLNADAILKASEQLPILDQDLSALQAEAQPVLWLSPTLGWVPDYGGDIKQAGPLLQLAQHLVRSAEHGGTALAPLLSEPDAEGATSSMATVLSLIIEGQPEISAAQTELKAAEEARTQIDATRLSPGLRDLLTNRVDPGMDLMRDGLSLGMAFPTVMGAGMEGPKTYLLVVQNEDELRPTGGFITAVGKLVLDQGHVVHLSFENSGDLDNWSMPYPMAPWQLQQFMNSDVLILRDTNWFPDFPTAVLYFRQLYAYARQDSVDGVIAFDQQTLIMLLKELGPVEVAGADQPITADNVVEFMRESKTPPAGEPLPQGWTNKAFIGALAQAVLTRIISADASEWRPLSQVVYRALQERHVLLQLDQTDLQSILARRGWNGGLASNGGDFLMVIDSNVGFNKTNAVVDTRLSYEVDLSNPLSPSSEIRASHSNHASADVPCVQWKAGAITGEEDYPIDRCYWDYMRIYRPQGTRLTGSNPQSIPDSWMMLERHAPAVVDVLDERLPGLSSFGTMLVVPGGGTVETSMEFALPPAQVVVQEADGAYAYSLLIRKQPGTAAIPIHLRIHLPAGATLESQPAGWTLDGQDMQLEANLQIDLQVEIRFRTPDNPK